MLVEFRVENHRSIRDEQILAMEEVDDDSGAESASISSVAAIYGANASGKSSLLAALRFMRDAVSHSQRLWSPDEGVPRDPFAWGTKLLDPSLFEVTIMLAGVRHQYGFVVDDSQILEEWLHVYPLGRKQVWFERDGASFKFGDHLKGENRLVEKITRPNSLFLSSAVQNGHEQLRVVYRWFRSIQTHNLPRARGRHMPMLFGGESNIARWLSADAAQGSLFPSALRDSNARIARFRELLQVADFGISDVRLEEGTDDDHRRGRPSRIFLRHGTDGWLPLEQESQGTQQLFRLGPVLIDALIGGRVLLVDELEASFHPLLALEIVRIFGRRTTNPNHAQLIFTTHDTNLLGTTVGAPSLSRGQVWLTEKDQEGATRLYPLTNYTPRKSENLERGYLQGRYGAIPFLGELSALTEPKNTDDEAR